MAHYVYSQKQIVDCLAVPMDRKLVAELQDGFQKWPALWAFAVFNLKKCARKNDWSC